MCGGNKGQTTTNQTQTYAPNPAAMGYITNAMGRAADTANMPFNVPQAPVAGFSQDQQGAFQQFRDAQGMAQPYYNRGQDYFAKSARGPDVSQFFNPYAGAVTAGLKDIFGQQNTQNNGNLVQAAGGVGADRIAVGQSELARQQGLSAGQTLASLYAPSLSAATQEQQILQSAGTGTAALGQNAQNAAFQGANAMLGTGGLQQQLSQAQLNAPYQWQVAQAAFPYQQAQFLAGTTASLAPGLGGTTTGQGTSQAPQPSIWSQLLGAGMAGVGAYKGFSGGGGGSANGSNSGAGDGSWYGQSSVGGKPLSARGGRINPYYAEGGEVVSHDPIDISHLPIIPNVQLQPMQSHIPQLNLNPQPQQQQSGGPNLGDIAKIAMMFANRGGAVNGENPFGYAEGGGARPPSGSVPTLQITPEIAARMQRRLQNSADDSATQRVINDAAKYGVDWSHYGRSAGGSVGGNNPYGYASGGAPSMEDRFSPVREALDDGTFDPVGANNTTFAGMPGMARANSGEVPMPRARPTPYDAMAFSGAEGEEPAVSAINAAAGTEGPGANAYAPAARARVPGTAGEAPGSAASAAAPDSNASTRDPGPAANPWLALMSAGLGMMGGTSPYAGVNIGQGAMAGVKTLQEQRTAAQKDEATDQAARRLALEAKHHEDQYTKMTPYQKAMLDQEKYSPAGSIQTKDGLHPAFVETRTGKVIDGVTQKPPEKTDTVIAKGGSRNSPEEISHVVDGIIGGSQPPVLTGLYGDGVHVRSGLHAKGFNLAKAQQEWEAQKKLTSSVNSQRMVQYVGLNQSVDRTIDEVNSLSKELQQGGVPLLNRLQLQAYINAEGNSEKGQLATRYMTAVNTLKEEFANLANGGYAPTEAAWKLANEQVNGNFGVKQMEASLTEIQRLIRYRLQAVPGLATQGPGSPNRYTGQGVAAVPAAAAPAGGGGKPDVATRFGQIVGGGKSEEEAYAILHEEGYR